MAKSLSHVPLYFPCLPEISVGLIDPSEKMKTGKYKNALLLRWILSVQWEDNYTDVNGQMRLFRLKCFIFGS